MRPRFNPWVRKISWRREWYPLQYSCLENSMYRGAWWATVHGVAKRHDWLTLSLSLLYPTKIPLSSECSQWSQLRFMVYSLNWIPGWMRDHSREKGSEPCFLDHISVIWGSAPLTLLASHWDGDSHLGPLGMLMEALCGISGHLEDWNTSLSPFRIALPCSLCLLVALLLEYVRLCRC